MKIDVNFGWVFNEHGAIISGGIRLKLADTGVGNDELFELI